MGLPRTCSDAKGRLSNLTFSTTALAAPKELRSSRMRARRMRLRPSASTTARMPTDNPSRSRWSPAVRFIPSSPPGAGLGPFLTGSSLSTTTTRLPQHTNGPAAPMGGEIPPESPPPRALTGTYPRRDGGSAAPAAAQSALSREPDLSGGGTMAAGEGAAAAAAAGAARAGGPGPRWPAGSLAQGKRWKSSMPR